MRFDGVWGWGFLSVCVCVCVSVCLCVSVCVCVCAMKAKLGDACFVFYRRLQHITLPTLILISHENTLTRLSNPFQLASSTVVAMLFLCRLCHPPSLLLLVSFPEIKKSVSMWQRMLAMTGIYWFTHFAPFFLFLCTFFSLRHVLLFLSCVLFTSWCFLVRCFVIGVFSFSGWLS